jgi:uncharacterized membrane protein (UPF0127 family)
MKDGDTLQLRTPSGQRFEAEVVISAGATKKGLMFRDGLPSKSGMFFLYTDPAKRRSMWMNNMRFPLDVVWLDGSLTIVSIRYNCEPCISEAKCPRISSIRKAQHAIEFSAGDADLLGLEIGQTLKLLKSKEVK